MLISFFYHVFNHLGVTGAAAGTLTFMVGGSEATLERARVFLSAMGKNIVHCGGPGAGGKQPPLFIAK